MDTQTSDSQHPHPVPPRHSKIGRLLKWLLIGGSLLILALLAAGILLLTYLFPSELVRQELEVRSSEMLDADVKIHHLSFNLLTGLELQGVEFIQHQQPLFTLRRLNLDYSLWGLINGNFKINEVLIDRADIALDLPSLQTPSPEEPPPPPPSAPPSIPPLPISFDLASLEIRESRIKALVSPTLAVDVADLNLEVTGGLAPDQAKIEGALTIGAVAAAVEDRSIRLPLDIRFDLEADLPEQRLVVHRLGIASDPAMRFTLSGTIQDFLADMSLDLALHDVEFRLQPLIELAKDFVPPDLAAITVDGTISPTVRIQGTFPETGFEGTVNVGLEAKQFAAELPQFFTTIHPTDLSLQASDVNVRENTPQFGTLTVKLSNTATQYQNYAVRDFHLDLMTEYFAAGPLSGRLELSGLSTVPPLGPLEEMTVPIHLDLHAQGNHKSENVDLKEFALKLGNLVTIQARGSLRRPPQNAGHLDLSLSTRLEPHIAKLLPLVPPEFLEGVNIRKGRGPDVIVMNVTTSLAPDYRPSGAKVTTGIKLSNVMGSLKASPLGGTLSRANVLISSTYDGKTGRLQGTVGTALVLSDLHQGGNIAIGQTRVKLKSTLSGLMTSEYALTDLRTQDALTIQVADIIYDDPSIKAGIDRLLVSSKTTTDLFGQEYAVQQFRVTSEPLFDVSAKGRYRLPNQQFSIAAEIPYLNIGNILRHLSGDLVTDLNEINPQGRFALSLTASGRVPEQADLDRLAIPVEAQVTATLNNVEGGFAQHHVQGAGGTLALLFQPGDHPLARVATDFKVDAVRLAPELPLHQIANLKAKVNVSVTDFNDIDIDEFDVGLDGAAVGLKGTVTGIKAFLKEPTQPGKALSTLFAKLATRASLDLGQFQEVLKPAGLKGSGSATVDLSLLKKERGPIDARLALRGQTMNVSQDGLKIQNLNGGLSIRKHLAWNPDSSAPSPRRSFNPTDVLSQLRTLTGRKKNLTIDTIDLGFVTISNFGTHLLFDRNAFKIQNLAMNLLGGGLGGDVVVTTSKPIGVTTRLEAARLDLNQLLDEDLRIGGDSVVDATIGLSVFVEEDTGALDLTRTELSLYITHIGQEALDRLLVFLDPEGSNPTLVSARSQVKLANPSRVTIRLTRGMMNLEILFGSGLVPDFILPRLPVGRIKNLRTLTQGVANWATIAQGLAIVGAESYGITPEGSIRFR